MKGEHEEWFGAPATPHVAGDLRLLKAVLNDGGSVAFRRDQQFIWVQRGSEAHRRANPDGAILSVIPVGGADTPSVQQINKAKALRLSKSGGDLHALASFPSYRFAPEVQEEDPYTMQKMGSVASAVSTRGVTAICYAGGIMDIQGFWWLARHITWLRDPIMIPVAVAFASLAGLTPSIMGNALLLLVQTIGAFVMQHALKLSKTWLGDPRFRFIPLILLLGDSAAASDHQRGGARNRKMRPTDSRRNLPRTHRRGHQLHPLWWHRRPCPVLPRSSYRPARRLHRRNVLLSTHLLALLCCFVRRVRFPGAVILSILSIPPHGLFLPWLRFL